MAEINWGLAAQAAQGLGNPVPQYRQGMQARQERDVMNARSTLAQLAGLGPDAQAQHLLASGDLQGAGILQQLALGQHDRQFRQRESDRNQSNQDRSYGLQQQALKTGSIHTIQGPDGSQRLVRVGNDGTPQDITPGGVQQPANPNFNVPPGLDPKTFRAENTKNYVKNLEAAPQAITTATSMLNNVDSVLNDPALPGATGVYSLLQKIPATQAYGFGQKVEQLKGQAFLQAFESLKGGGAITQIEGEKATAAIARLNTAQRTQDYTAALTELRTILATARDRQQKVLDDHKRYTQPQNQTQQQPQQFQNGMTATGPGGQKIQFQNGQWVPVQ